MGEGDWFSAFLGFVAGVVFTGIIMSVVGLSAEKVATQICQFLDNDLIDYETEGRKFEYIKCGDKKLIEGLDAEKLIEVLKE